MSIEVYPRVNDEDMVICAIDPGDEWVGVAVGCRYFVDRTDEDRDEPPYTGWELRSPGWRVYATAEMTPDQAADWFDDHLFHGRFDIVTVERWTMYEDKKNVLVGSEMMTSQLIGYLRHETRQFNQAVASGKKPWNEYAQVQWEQNPAAIQTPTKGVLKRLGIKSRAKADHHHNALSAELHLWHTLIRHGMVEGVRGDRERF